MTATDRRSVSMRNGRCDAAIGALRTLLGERLSTAQSVRDLHGRDESSFAGSRPDAVAFPRSTAEVAAILATCVRHHAPVIPFGAGSSLEGHVLPTRGGVTVDTQLMDSVGRVSVADLTATVQAGVRRSALERRLGGDGLFFSVDPGADASLGGMAATGASGTTTVRYGTMRENVLAMEVVLADGTTIHTGTQARKSSAGYDLTRLFIGSEGTLGLITELTLRLHPIPEAISSATCSFPSVDAAVATAIATVQLGVPVARCELVDPATMAAVNRHSGLDRPEAPTLFLEFHGTPAGVEEDARSVAEVAQEHGAGDFEWASRTEERNRLWRARHNAYFAALALRPGCRAITTDVCVPLSRLAACIDDTLADIGELPFPVLLLGHVADGNFHVLLLIDPDDPSERRLASSAYDRMVSRALAAGGTCSGEHGVGLGKRRALVAEAGPAVEVMRGLKRALDPAGILNPDKVLSGSEPQRFMAGRSS
jgi:D-lactate dehydrogenase (cytochrome)